MTITRKTFLTGALSLVAGSLGLVALTACDDEPTPTGSGGSGGDGTGNNGSGAGGSGGDASGGAGDCVQHGAAASGGAIGGQHPAGTEHFVTISAAQLDAASPTSFDIRGDSGHGHTIMLTSADFTALNSGQPVTVTSDVGGGHSHEVTLTCV